MLSRPRGRRGFSLAEVLAAVAIVAMLASVMIPAVLNRLTDSRVDAIIGEMQSLQDAIQLFHRDVGRYPSRLDYLAELPGAGVVDACNAAISAANQAKFRGPYITRMLTDTTGAAVPTRYILATADTVALAITRTVYVATSGGNQRVLQLTVSGLEEALIERVDSTVDGSIDRTRGTVRYAATEVLENSLLWTIPIKDGDC